jgi:O-antigen/teichoic acid export membrane protein
MSLVVKHAGFDVAGTGISNAIMFATSIVVTRTLGAELFGRYSLAQTIFFVLVVLAVFGLNDGCLKLTSKYNVKHDKARVKGTLLSGMLLTGVFSGLLTILTVLLAPTIAARFFPNVEGFSRILRILVIGLPFLALMMVLNGYTQGFKTLKYSVIVEFITRPSVKLVAVVSLFLVGLRLDGVIYATVIACIAASGLGYYFARRMLPGGLHSVRAHLVTRELFFYSLPLVLSRFMLMIMTRSNTILVGYFTDSINTGLFGAAVTLSPLIWLSVISFTKIFSPIISEFWETGNLPELEKTLKTVTKWTFTLGLPVALLFLLFAPSLLLVFGADFSRAGTTLRILAAGQIANLFVGPVGYLLVMTGRQRLNLINAAGTAIANVSLSIVLIPRYGIAGAALGVSIPVVLVSLARAVQIKKMYGFMPFRRDLYKPALAGVISFVTLYLLKRHLGLESLAHTLILCVIFTAIYFGLLYALGLKEEREVLADVLKRRR